MRHHSQPGIWPDGFFDILAIDKSFSIAGILVKLTPWAASWVRGRITALCSREETRQWSPGLRIPFKRKLREWVMFKVKTTFCGSAK
jgi:hypothetical protein